MKTDAGASIAWRVALMPEGRCPGGIPDDCAEEHICRVSVSDRKMGLLYAGGASDMTAIRVQSRQFYM